MRAIHKYTAALSALTLMAVITTTEAISADQVTDYEREVLQAIRCNSSSDCSQFMLRGSLNNQPELIDVAAARMQGFAKTVKGNPSLARDYNKKGLDAFHSKDYQTASDLFGLAYQADPTNVEVVANYGYALSMNGKRQEALSKLVEALSLNPRRTSNWAPLVKVYHDLGMQNEAVGAALLSYYYSTSKEKTLIYLKDRVVNETPPSLSSIYQAAYVKVSAQDSNVRPQGGVPEVSSGSRPMQQLQASSAAYKAPEEKVARPESGSRGDRAAISNIPFQASSAEPPIIAFVTNEDASGMTQAQLEVEAVLEVIETRVTDNAKSALAQLGMPIKTDSEATYIEFGGSKRVYVSVRSPSVLFAYVIGVKRGRSYLVGCTTPASLGRGISLVSGACADKVRETFGSL